MRLEPIWSSPASRTAVNRPVPASTPSNPIAEPTPRLRIKFGESMRLGPGKVELLDAVATTGSISAASRALGMSYRRAWILVDEVNRMFKRPVVVTAAGGHQGGGASLTDFGRALVAAYRRIEARTRLAIREELAPFEGELAEPLIRPR